ncbi:MAG: ABC transporter ATP-binding protein [Clostridia bacterium]|nr:ABC transporter ATP-binding protein [Clostridia bacterium]
MNQARIVLKNVCKQYGESATRVQALDQVSLQIARAEMVAIVGPSGCGKTTLLNLLGGLDQADEGSVTVDGRDLGLLHERELTEFRRNQVGFIFQSSNLMPNLTALQNLRYIAEIVKAPLDPLQELERVGLGDRRDHYPAQLSGGEQQRVAIALALVKNPWLILADEPTAALDEQAGAEVLRLLEQPVRERGCTLIIVTHNRDITPIADRVVFLRDGRVEKVTSNEHPSVQRN